MSGAPSHSKTKPKALHPFFQLGDTATATLPAGSAAVGPANLAAYCTKAVCHGFGSVTPSTRSYQLLAGNGVICTSTIDLGIGTTFSTFGGASTFAVSSFFSSAADEAIMLQLAAMWLVDTNSAPTPHLPWHQNYHWPLIILECDMEEKLLQLWHADSGRKSRASISWHREAGCADGSEGSGDERRACLGFDWRGAS